MTSRYEDLLLSDQREKIVERVVRALKSRDQLSANTLNNFRRVLQAGTPIRGFNKDPIRALPPLLKQHILERIEGNSEFELLLVEVWAEAEPHLQEAVNQRLDSFDLQSHEGDEIDEELWDAQVSMLAAENSDYEEDDILLMTKVCFAHAKIKADASRDTDSGDTDGDAVEVKMDTAPAVLSDVLNRLRMLPAESQAWHEDIPRFAEALNDLISTKDEERNRLSRMLEDFEELQRQFSSELEFFGRQAADWGIDRLGINRLATSASISEAAQKFSELETALANYRAVTDRADRIDEERQRREQRHDLEDAIERILSEIDDLAQNADTPDYDPSTGAPILSETEASADSAETQPQPQLETYSVLQDELNALRGEYESLLSSNPALKQDSASIEDKVRVLEGEIAGLNADKQTLTEEVAELRDQLRISETKEINWRNAYEVEMISKDSSVHDPIPAEVESVSQALDLAQARYRDRLVFRLNKKSKRDYDYTRPREVWDALEWLATTYHDSQTGEAQIIDLNESIRNTCSGWEYKPNQTDITFNTFREWYTTTKDGKTYELRKHLSKGTGRDANVIRIAFAWDEDSERVIVGFVGPHQRSRSS